MDGWGDMNRLERDIARIGIGIVAAATVVGGAVGWVVGQVVTHLHDPGISDYPKKARP